MSVPTASTTAQIISAVGSNSQEQKWVKEIVTGSQAKNPFTEMSGPMAANKAIKVTAAMQNLQGKTVNFQSRAPLGGKGTQGSSATRSGVGEEIKFKMWQLSLGNHHHSVSQNNVAAEQTVLGQGSFDKEARGLLKPWFAQLRSRTTEAEIIRASLLNPSRLVVYPNSATSIATLTGADTVDTALFTEMSQRLTSNQARPFTCNYVDGQPIDRYALLFPHTGLKDMHIDSTWQTLMGNAHDRGSKNALFTGKIPDWYGSYIYEWVVQQDQADGPQGALCSPVAYTGATIAAGTAAFEVKGGGTTTAGALTDRNYFEFFPNAAFATYEQTKITAATGEQYALIWLASEAKFGMIAYTTNNGNKLTGTKKLGATSAGTGATTVGSVVWSSLGVWANKMVDLSATEVPVGAPVYPCNAKGQCFGYGYGLGLDALISGWGSVVPGQAMGRRTVNNDDDMQRLAQIGYEEQWGITAIQDANGLTNGLVLAIYAWNPPGAPTAIV